MNQQEEELRQALGKMMALCVRREYASGDLVEKLRKMQLEESGIAWVMEQLQREKYQDDLRYAVAFSRDKSRLSGWGERKIAYALRQKGVSEEVVRQAWSEVDRREADRKMEAVFAAKVQALQRKAVDDETIFLRLLAYAQQKGYTWEQVRQYWKNNKTKER